MGEQKQSWPYPSEISNIYFLKMISPVFPFLHPVSTLNPMHPFVTDPTERAQEVSKHLANMNESEVAKCLQELADSPGPC